MRSTALRLLALLQLSARSSPARARAVGINTSTLLIAQVDDLSPFLVTTDLEVDPTSPGLTYDGHGGLSAGASSRLLLDYDEQPRSEILDCTSHLRGGYSRSNQSLFITRAQFGERA